MWNNVDEMWEAETAEAWESKCEPDNLFKGRAAEAVTWLEAVLNHLSDIDGWISEAASELDGYPEEHRIISLMDSAGDLRASIIAEVDRLTREAKA